MAFTAEQCPECSGYIIYNTQEAKRNEKKLCNFCAQIRLTGGEPPCYNTELRGMGVVCAHTERPVTNLISQLQTEHKVVGVKQSRKAVQRGEARLVFLAEDADPQVTEPMQALCNEAQVPVELIPRMRELGAACGIRLGCAVAALLKEAE